VSAEEISVVTLKPRHALPFFSQHPWVFPGAIQSVSGLPEVGTAVQVRSHEGKFIAHGLFNPGSKIRVRLYSWEEDRPLNEDFWRERLTRAIRFREQLFAGTTDGNGCRLVFSEADGLSGLTIDRMNDWLVLQWTSAALQQREQVIVETLQALLNPRGIVLRTERGMKELESLDVNDGLLCGELPPRSLQIEENGLKFLADLQAGQKTGYYFDQRQNRRLLQRYGSGRLLDLCCYTGAFALVGAASGRFSEVIGVDSSQPAIELARKNAELNGLAQSTQFHAGDMGEFLQSQIDQQQLADTIVLDPPKLARTRSGLERAARAYVRLNRLAMQALKPDGILMTCSCSGHVSRTDFEQILLRAALEAGRQVQILEECGQAADHPVSISCLETGYLKCFVCRVL
jgi:23S rRNA (cytosine1962-C5)-methyltransferase